MLVPSADASARSSVADRIRALIVDDHPMFRQAFREVLARQPAAIVDVVLPETRGVAFVRHLRASQPSDALRAVLRGGRSVPAAACEQLHLSTRTVETHRLRIMRKVGARSLTDMFQLALRHGLV